MCTSVSSCTNCVHHMHSGAQQTSEEGIGSPFDITQVLRSCELAVGYRFVSGFENKFFNPKESNIIQVGHPLSEILGIRNILGFRFSIFSNIYIHIIGDETETQACG